MVYSSFASYYAKKSLSSLQLSRDINVTQTTAWFMLHRIRAVTKLESFSIPLKSTVEIDETCIGGKEKNKHQNKKTKSTQGCSTKTKTVVIGMIERNGNAQVQVITKVNSKTIEKIAINNILIGSTILSDEWGAYKVLEKLYNHEYINHDLGKYIRESVSTNTIESFWALFKRGIIGLSCSIRKKHIERYLNEFVFRCNHKNYNVSNMFNAILLNTGNYLFYKALVGRYETQSS
ncbi:IS1595 family transposase [Candidatus Rickettsia barbariae]